MNPVILMRTELAEDGELEAAKKYFKVERLVSAVKPHEEIIPRYSCLPYYWEFEANVRKNGGRVINYNHHHKWIAEFRWYFSSPELRELTPRTWKDDEFYTAPEGRYIVKGRTNSRKEQWKSCMYAENKRDAVKIGCDLYSDSLIGSQGLIYREYIPLRTFEVGINGLPFTNEHRFFILDGQIITHGYYWANADNTDVEISEDGIEFAHQVIDIIGPTPRFYVIDIAETEEGQWILIEINDASMSGLSCIPPDKFYKELKTLLENNNGKNKKNSTHQEHLT